MGDGGGGWRGRPGWGVGGCRDSPGEGDQPGFALPVRWFAFYFARPSNQLFHMSFICHKGHNALLLFEKKMPKSATAAYSAQQTLELEAGVKPQKQPQRVRGPGCRFEPVGK